MSDKFKHIFGNLQEKAAGFDASGCRDFLAVQVTFKDLGEAFYAEIKDGKLTLEPHGRSSRQANLVMSADNFERLMSRKLNPVIAFTTGKIKVEGDVGKALQLSKLFAK